MPPSAQGSEFVRPIQATGIFVVIVGFMGISGI
jgi:hypothetical protein